MHLFTNNKTTRNHNLEQLGWVRGKSREQREGNSALTLPFHSVPIKQVNLLGWWTKPDGKSQCSICLISQSVGGKATPRTLSCSVSLNYKSWEHQSNQSKKGACNHQVLSCPLRQLHTGLQMGQKREAKSKFHQDVKNKLQELSAADSQEMLPSADAKHSASIGFALK